MAGHADGRGRGTLHQDSHLMTQTERRDAEAWHLATLALIRASGCQTYEQWKAAKLR